MNTCTARNNCELVRCSIVEIFLHYIVVGIMAISSDPQNEQVHSAQHHHVRPPALVHDPYTTCMHDDYVLNAHIIKL